MPDLAAQVQARVDVSAGRMNGNKDRTPADSPHLVVIRVANVDFDYVRAVLARCP